MAPSPSESDELLLLKKLLDRGRSAGWMNIVVVIGGGMLVWQWQQSTLWDGWISARYAVCPSCCPAGLRHRQFIERGHCAGRAAWFPSPTGLRASTMG